MQYYCYTCTRYIVLYINFVLSCTESVKKNIDCQSGNCMKLLPKYKAVASVTWLAYYDTESLAHIVDNEAKTTNSITFLPYTNNSQ